MSHLKTRAHYLLIAVLVSGLVSTGHGLETPALPVAGEIPEQLAYRVVRSYPHDHQAVTQGMVFADGYLYESTGLFGESSIRKTRLGAAEPLELSELEHQRYGEGLTLYQDQLYQLTWRSGTGFIYDKDTLAKKRVFHYSGEGWGLTHNRHQFIMSDGSSRLQFLDPETMRPSRQLQVTDHRGPVMRLNELEYIDGHIFANILYDTRIARIHPDTGKVTGWIDLSELAELHPGTPDDPNIPAVANGIAWDERNRRMYVTGKQWPTIYEIELITSHHE